MKKWNLEALRSLLRFGSKNSGPWDEGDCDEWDIPGPGDAELIIEAVAYYQEAKSKGKIQKIFDDHLAIQDIATQIAEVLYPQLSTTATVTDVDDKFARVEVVEYYKGNEYTDYHSFPVSWFDVVEEKFSHHFEREAQAYLENRQQEEQEKLAAEQQKKAKEEEKKEKEEYERLKTKFGNVD